VLRIGIDVGGTFTDLVCVDAQGGVTIAKVPSTPGDQSLGVMDGLGRLAETLGLDRKAMLARTERIVHGTTVATNALLEHKGARVGLLTTEGHRDIIEMREGLKDDRYNLRQPPPVQLVPRERRLGVRERIRPDGRVEIALDRGSLETAIATLKQQGVEAVAICYLHSWRDGSHERATAEVVRAAMPGVYVALSGPTCSRPLWSTLATEPPPAPMLAISRLCRATRWPPIRRSEAMAASPPTTREMSVEVPPMSNGMRSPWPSSRAAYWLPATPPAGPESTPPAASRTASPMVATPPCDWMMRTGAVSPASRSRPSRRVR